MMEIVETSIAPRGTERGALGTGMVTEYLQRSGRYCSCSREVFADEPAFWIGVAAPKLPGRTFVTLLDSRGNQMSSEAFAARLARLRDDGTRRLILGVGPADGWTAASRERADHLLSLGPMTLPHQLARIVLAEQVYRALTILAGHPYHSGH